MNKLIIILTLVFALLISGCSTVEVANEPIVEETAEPVVDVTPEVVTEPVVLEPVVPEGITIVDDTSKEYFAVIGDEFSHKGHTIKLVSISADAAVVSVDGEKQIIKDGASVNYETVNDYKIKAKNVFYDINKEDRSAYLIFFN